MAASTFALACDAMLRARDEEFLGRVAADYNLDLAELTSKFLSAECKSTKVYKKREPKSVSLNGAIVKSSEKASCTAHTAKNLPCKFGALKGEVFCKRHLNAQNFSEVAKAAKRIKAPKGVQPVHTHKLDNTLHGDCDTCQTYGNPLIREQDFEVVDSDEPLGCASQLPTPFGSPEREAVPAVFEVPQSVRDRLAAMLSEAEDDDDDEPGPPAAQIPDFSFAVAEEAFCDE